MSMIIECPFAGCNAKIDVVADIEEMVRDMHPDDNPSLASVHRIPWLIHTVMCPKCGNCVADLDVYPGFFTDLEGKNRHINTVKGRTAGRMMQIGHDREDMNRHLKKWARRKRDPLDRRAWVVTTKKGLVVVTSEWRLDEMKKSKGYVSHAEASLKGDP